MHIGGTGGSQRLLRDVETRFVHHLEHDFHALAFLAQQPADALVVVAKGQRAGGRALDAHFVLDTGSGHIVAFADRAIRIHKEFGNDKNGDAGRSRRIAVDSRQHGVNDVFIQVVVAGGDENFRAGDFVSAVRLLDGSWFSARRRRNRHPVRSDTSCRPTGRKPFSRHRFF